MGLFDDIKKQAEEASKKLGSNVEAYLKTNVTNAFVKVGEPPKGNLTAEQIAQGQKGQAQEAAIALPQSGLQMVTGNMGMILPIVAGLVVLMLVLKKR